MKEYVKIKGKEYPVNFGSWCHREFEEDTGVSMHNAFMGSTAATSIDMAYHGLKDGARMDKQSFEFADDKPALADWLDEEGEDALKNKETPAAGKILNIWLKSMGYPVLKYKDGLLVRREDEPEAEPDDDTKKKKP